ncbi:hypothetical protein HNP48_006528 [Acidovorax soli]|jgi:hypothetical protein|uniref:DUF4148 domain-containing protein n=1 Tax=Acidovorax soli TaxID=592050 RepID=A0A7X0PKT5_9BURK|nr:DUF4148 domain-containing protein [Acidovorax soli]MBB6563802.1 hypothetical protein [Acidovorax soli]
MNQHKTVFAILLCIGAAGNAFADDITVDTTPFTSTKSRAEVLAELRQPAADPWALDYNPLASFKSQLSRAEVQSAFLADRAEVAALQGEDSGSAYLARAATGGDNGNTRTAGLGGQPFTTQ